MHFSIVSVSMNYELDDERLFPYFNSHYSFDREDDLWLNLFEPVHSIKQISVFDCGEYVPLQHTLSAEVCGCAHPDTTCAYSDQYWRSVKRHSRAPIAVEARHAAMFSCRVGSIPNWDDLEIVQCNSRNMMPLDLRASNRTTAMQKQDQRLACTVRHMSHGAMPVGDHL